MPLIICNRKNLTLTVPFKGVLYGKRILKECPKRDSVYFAIDGKQRISTVKLFIDDGFVLTGLDPIELKDPETGDIEEVDINGLHFSELDDVFQDAIESATLTVIVINEATDDEICEYFYYLNNGMPLNRS